MKKRAEELLKESIGVKEEFLKHGPAKLADITKVIAGSLKSGGKLILFGNGGSAADSQHIAAELVGRFKKDRPPISAIALSTNTSTITALGNDYGYETSFSRQLEALARKGDVAMGISTSGNSPNVIEAIKTAEKLGLKTIAMTGRDGGKLAGLADITLKVPSDNTPRIQELHITAGHIICELIEGQI
ncbi:MAG: D-sedoheptulose 7-phosphate isomerase [Candidatus Omnitrophica bacterium]|nr:D-sedoheptulose 7-phosphate isomerase [Candidatus Omnitrophota bacterium]